MILIHYDFYMKLLYLMGRCCTIEAQGWRANWRVPGLSPYVPSPGVYLQGQEVSSSGTDPVKVFVSCTES